MKNAALTLLQKHFNIALEAPDGIKKLRLLILTLAMQGKLVPQDSNDQPARELLKEIEAEKKRLVKEGIIKAPKALLPINPEDVPYEVPEGWEWIKVTDIGDIKTGATPSTSNHDYYGGNIKWLVSGDINKGLICECEGRITEAGLKNSNCKIIPSDSLLIALNGQGKTRATVAILRVEAALNQSLVAIIPYIERRILTEFFFWYLRNRYQQLRELTGDNKRSGLNMKIIANLFLPFPPLTEQKRIVAKVDQLMALCDNLEKSIEAATKKKSAVLGAILAQV